MKRAFGLLLPIGFLGWIAGCTTDASGLATEDDVGLGDTAQDTSIGDLGLDAFDDTTAPPVDTNDDTADTTVTPDSDATLPDTGTPDTSETSCTAPKIACGGKCVDPTADSANCGGCGKTCPTGSTCKDDGSGKGVCDCGAGKGICTGVCTDLTKDPNCGACGTSCPTAIKFSSCGAGSICDCPGAGTACGGVCTDTDRDPKNCGGCGVSAECFADTGCSGGKCICRPGLTACGACTDLKGDAAHCGGCSTTCSKPCVNGVCATSSSATCPTGRTACGNSCWDLQNDANHCGGCSTSCSPTEVCVAGACKGYAPTIGGGVTCAALMGTAAIDCDLKAPWGHYCVVGSACPGTL